MCWFTEICVKEFFSEVRQVDRDNEVTRIIWAFKINPYEQLNLRFDASPDDVRRQYRKLSLLVHPDKCSHPQARQAFESARLCIRNGSHDCVCSPRRRSEVSTERREKKTASIWIGLCQRCTCIVSGKACLACDLISVEEIRKEWRKKAKHDSAVRIAGALHEVLLTQCDLLCVIVVPVRMERQAWPLNMKQQINSMKNGSSSLVTSLPGRPGGNNDWRSGFVKKRRVWRLRRRKNAPSAKPSVNTLTPGRSNATNASAAGAIS